MSTPITHPTALTDQVHAVAGHARRVLTTAAKRGSVTLDATPPARWLAGHAAALRTAIEQRTVRACPHLGRKPQLLFAAAWRPGHLVCLNCLPALDPDPTDATNCDRCSRPAEHLDGSIAAFGPILFTYALCPHCVTAGDVAA